jgi:hypothetical protein
MRLVGERSASSRPFDDRRGLRLGILDLPASLGLGALALGGACVGRIGLASAA